MSAKIVRSDIRVELNISLEGAVVVQQLLGCLRASDFPEAGNMFQDLCEVLGEPYEYGLVFVDAVGGVVDVSHIERDETFGPDVERARQHAEGRG